MRSAWGILLLFTIAPAGVCRGQVPAAPAPASRPSHCLASTYPEFVRQVDAWAAEGRSELSIMQISGEDNPVAPAMAKDYGECYGMVQQGIDIASDGTFTEYIRGFTGNSSFGKFDDLTMVRIRTLASGLPPGGDRLPPPGRRLVVHSAAFGTRVYDRAHLSDAMLALIQLTRAWIEVIQPVFTPDATVTAQELRNIPVPCHRNATVSPDGRLGIFNSFTTPYLAVYEGSDWCSVGLPRGGSLIRTIPETWPSKHYGDVALRTEFMPDGRYLLSDWGPSGVVSFDTETWQIVHDPNVFPANLGNYTHSPDWKIVIGWPLQPNAPEPPPGTPDPEPSQALVWDATTHSFLAPLPIHGFLHWNDHAFSPDGRLLVFMGPASEHQKELSIWDLRKGVRLRTLTPAQGTVLHGEPLWWNAGQWLVAEVYGKGQEGEAIWDAMNGRFLGTAQLTSECHTNLKTTVVDERLRVACGTQYALEWTVDGVERQVAAWADGRMP